MRLLRGCTLIRFFYRAMAAIVSEDLVPVGVRGMKNLEPDKFRLKIQVPVLKVREDNLSKIIQLSKPYLMKMEHFKPIQNLEEDIKHKKCLHLSPSKVKDWQSFPEPERLKLQELGVNEDNFSSRDLELTYNNWKYEQIFKAVLPENEETVSGFSQIGHIIHLNLRDHLLEYRFLIGKVLVDKIKNCRTVINKNNIIDNTYRNFSMELLAGDENYIVTVKENNCNFQFDFSKVYWNPRLCKEHERIISFMKPGEVVFDIFCGVGPFAVPAAKKKVEVYANDLNPESYKWLNHNAKANKLNNKLFQSYNLDGKDFIRTVFKDYLIQYCKGEVKPEKKKIHITMNLPAMAVEFLKYFKGLVEDRELYDKLDCEIKVYVYCFVIGENIETVTQLAKELVSENIGTDMTEHITDVFNVRNVSPKKEMMRVTFELTKDVIFIQNPDEPPTLY